MRHTFAIGVDPGVEGALAVLKRDGEIVTFIDMPVNQIGTKYKLAEQQLGSFLREWRQDSIAIIEDVHSMQGWAHNASFSFGFITGAVWGAVGALLIPVEKVTPPKWKAHFRIGRGKDEARALASRKWPDKADLFALKKHDGRAEAALIALYYIETQGGGR